MSARSIDADARARIRDDLDATLVVEAAAGTGKTTALVARIVALLRSRRARRSSSIVAVTFTEKAAGEMKLRLRAEIERRARRRRGDRRARRASTRRSRSSRSRASAPSTAFCADLLRERPGRGAASIRCSRSPPRTRPSALFERRSTRWFQRALADPPEGVRRDPAPARARPRRERPRDAARRRAGAGRAARLRRAVAPRSVRSRRARSTRVLDELAALGALAARAPTRRRLARAEPRRASRASSTSSRGARRCAARDYDGLEAELRELVARRGAGTGRARRARRSAPGCSRAEVLARRDAAQARARRVARALPTPTSRALPARASCGRVVDAYERAQGARRQARLPRPAAARARPARATTPPCARSCSSASRTSSSTSSRTPIRCRPRSCCCSPPTIPRERDWRACAPAPGKLFLVGDPKQSIYRFRRADVALYEAIKRAARRATAPSSLHLTTSFRSVPAIQAAVNAAFAPRDAGGADGSQAALRAARAVPRRRRRRSPRWSRCRCRGRTATAASVTNWAIEESLPDAVGAFVDWLRARERLDGHRARRGDARADRRRATSACCSGASRASATT